VSDGPPEHEDEVEPPAPEPTLADDLEPEADDEQGQPLLEGPKLALTPRPSG
jgi:hypothetical protein